MGIHPESHNLPHPLSHFFGREEEIAQIHKLLSEARLLTLTGIGGSGKTSLAIRIASQSVRNYPGGVWLVELGELSDPTFIKQAIVATLGLHKQPGKPLMDTLIAAIEAKRMLLVLDNCEHLIDACAQVCQTLLVSCQNLQILATSRESLHVPGEVTWQVLPLSLPDAGAPLSPQEMLKYAAIQLFVDRAQSILPTFALSQQNIPEVIRLCRHVDGIPLAIELAAAWVNTLPIHQINERLDHSLQFLVRGNRTVPIRQQTLRATLDWSYDLLSEKEKALFRRLALFVSDFSLNAAESICSGDDLEENEVLNLLSQLVSKSFVLVYPQDSQPGRFRLLEIVRQYSLEKCITSNEEASLSDRFLDYYLAIAENARLEIAGPQEGKWVIILEQELDHLRTALRLSQEEPLRVEKGLRLASALSQFWQLRGLLSEGSRWLEELLERSPATPTQVRADALNSASFMAYFLQDFDRAAALSEEAREIFRILGDDRSVAWAIQQLSAIAMGLEDYDQANRLAEQSLSMLREMNDLMGTAVSLFNISELAFLSINDLVKAESSVLESLDLTRKIENKWAASRRLARLGHFSLVQGYPRRALNYLNEGLGLARDAGDKWGMMMNLGGMAALAQAQGRTGRAARLLAGSQAVFEVFSTHRRPVDRILYEDCEAAVKSQMGELAYQVICSEMHAKTTEQIVEYALAGPDRGGLDVSLEPNVLLSHSLTPLQESKAKYGGLTVREREVATQVALGKSNACIAEDLFVGVRTVEAHITRILTKLNFTSRTQIAGWAIHKGLAPPPQ